MIKPEIYSRNKLLAIGKKTVVIPLMREMRNMLSTMPAQEEVIRWLFDSNHDIAMQIARNEPATIELLVQRFTVLDLTYKVRFIIPSLTIDIERELFFEDDLGNCIPHLIDVILNKFTDGDTKCNSFKVILINTKPSLYTVNISKE